MKIIVSILAVAAFTVYTASASAAVPGEMTIQGKLTDSLGQPLPAGSNAFSFILFDSEIDGDAIWQEYFGVPNDAGGLWVARLGTINPLTPQVFDGSVRWLEIHVEIGDDPEVILSPRTPIVSSAYAIRVATIDGATGGVVTGSVITGQNHAVTGSNALVGGEQNTINGERSTIAGGYDNSTVGPENFIGGGIHNEAGGSGTGGHAFVGGGQHNIAGMQGAIGAGKYNQTGDAAVVGGGLSNSALGVQSVIGGGYGNATSGYATAVVGGSYNRARGWYSVVCGGGGFEALDSNLAFGENSFLGGGSQNVAMGDHAAIVGGQDNLASGELSTVGGGGKNQVDSSYAAVAGGNRNRAAGVAAAVAGGTANSATGPNATVPGGDHNIASDTASMAAGSYAVASYAHSFVWGDGSSDLDETVADASHQFKISARNGVRFDRAAGSTKTIRMGDHYRDNGIVAWARVASSGDIGMANFGVVSAVRNGAGNYTLTVDVTAGVNTYLIPIVSVEVDAAPTTAAAARLIYVNQLTTSTFDVYVTNGSHVAVDNDFIFMATAR